MEIFCFVMGLGFAFTHSLYLPSLTLLMYYIHRSVHMLLFFVIGLLFTYAHLWLNAPRNMPIKDPIPEALIQGTIVSIPKQKEKTTQFTFELDSLNSQPVQTLVQLSWYDHALPVRVGQRWQFLVKLKKPRNFSNIGSFDYVGFLHARHVYWTGYIKSTKSANVKLKDPDSKFNWLYIRSDLSNTLTLLSPNKTTAGIVEALTLNITNHISPEQWELFRRTGTIHLFGISGEHIALVFGLIFFLVKALWSRCYWLCLRIPSIPVAAALGFIAATIYAFLAGFEPPVQRALIGCFFYTLYCLGKQRFSSWQMWRYALFGVLCIEPHALFHQGFYFSFLAVACIILTQQRWRLKGYRASLAMQLACLLGLMPLSLYWYGYCSINAYVANLFAIPLVGFCIVPLALVTLVLCKSSWAWVFMKLVSFMIMLLLKGLTWVEHLSFLNFSYTVNSIEFVFALMGGLLLWLLLPVKPFKPFALLWFLIPFLPIRSTIEYGQALVHVLDVGQGLAIAVRTKHHVLLYDTGDQFFSGNDLGTLVVLPYLAALNITKLDTIVVSHPDKDHRGGLKSIQSLVPVGDLVVNEPKYYHQGHNCHEYPPWEWDGVQFKFLPIGIAPSDRNNSCCVLKISSAAGSILFTGDIESKAERYLIDHYQEQMHAQVLVIPHHGSKTSSSPDFLRAIAPEFAVVSLGFDNKFGFPHDKTLASLSRLGIELYRTDACGMIEVVLPKIGVVARPVCTKNPPKARINSLLP